VFIVRSSSAFNRLCSLFIVLTRFFNILTCSPKHVDASVPVNTVLRAQLIELTSSRSISVVTSGPTRRCAMLSRSRISVAYGRDGIHIFSCNLPRMTEKLGSLVWASSAYLNSRSRWTTMRKSPPRVATAIHLVP
jgi:hypothetical protein